jgi:hypothetical protein
MQGILLTEIFTRHRGRKTNVKLSRQFEETYSRVSLSQPLFETPVFLKILHRCTTMSCNERYIEAPHVSTLNALRLLYFMNCFGESF